MCLVRCLIVSILFYLIVARVQHTKNYHVYYGNLLGEKRDWVIYDLGLKERRR